MYKLIGRLILASVLVFSGAFSAQAFAGDTLQRVIDFEVLTVGMSGNQPPFSMTDRSGTAMGFDVDLATALAAAMQVKLELKQIPFGELMQALEDDKIDMVISGLAITPRRTEMVSFVGPYMMSGKSILTKSATLTEASSTAAFNNTDVKIFALRNSTSASFVRKAAPKATLLEIDNYDQGVAKLIAGEADAMVADMPICVISVLRFPDAGLTTLDRPLTVEPIGIAVSKDDPQFQNLVENYLNSYEKTGLLNNLREKWFEESDWLKSLP